VSTEQRDVRPFGSVEAFDFLLKHSVVRVGADLIETGGSLVLEEDVFLRSNVSLSLASDASAIAKAMQAAGSDLASLELELDDLSFAVVLSSGYLKIAEFQLQMPLSQLATAGPNLLLSGPPRPAALRSPRAGCQIEALIHLSRERPRRPLRPWRYGTWIASARFGILTQHAFTGFTPKPLTPEKKAELRLPAKTVRYITLGGASPVEEGVAEDSVEVWFDADLLAKMSANPRSKASVALQRQLFVDAIATVLSDSRVTEDFDQLTWADLQDTLLGRVVALVAPSHANEGARTAACMTYLKMIQDEPAQFLAYAEECAGLMSALDAELGG
jgi:hypothetical protein